MTEETNVSTDAENESAAELDLWSIYETNVDAEEDGAWFYPGGDIGFKLRRFESKASQDCRKRLMIPYEAMERAGKTLPQGIMEDLLNKQLAESIVVDWKNVKDKDGTTLECTSENVMKILVALPHLRTEIVQFVLKIDNYRSDQKDESVKN